MSHWNEPFFQYDKKMFQCKEYDFICVIYCQPRVPLSPALVLPGPVVPPTPLHPITIAAAKPQHHIRIKPGHCVLGRATCRTVKAGVGFTQAVCKVHGSGNMAAQVEFELVIVKGLLRSLWRNRGRRGYPQSQVSLSKQCSPIRPCSLFNAHWAGN